MKDTIEVFKNFDWDEIIAMTGSVILCCSEFSITTLVLSIVACVYIFTSSGYRQLNDHHKNLLDEVNHGVPTHRL